MIAMFQAAPTLQNWFMTNVAPILLSFLAVVMPALAAWIVALLKANHKENMVANAASSAKMDTVVMQTNGVNERLQDHIDNQAEVIATLRAGATPIIVTPPAARP